MTKNNFFKEKPVLILEKSIELTGDLISGAILTDIYFYFSEKNRENGFLILNGEKWAPRSFFNWSNRLRISKKTLDRFIKKLKQNKLIKTKLFKVNNAPTLHLNIDERHLSHILQGDSTSSKENSVFYEDNQNAPAEKLNLNFPEKGVAIALTFPGKKSAAPVSFETEKLNLCFKEKGVAISIELSPLDSKEKPRDLDDLSHLKLEAKTEKDSKENLNSYLPPSALDFPKQEKTYNSSRSIYTSTKASSSSFSAGKNSKASLTTQQKALLQNLDTPSLKWEDKFPLLKANFNEDIVEILGYLEDCPLNWEQKTQLFVFEPEDVFQAIERTKQSKIKKTFMHCLMHACIHGLRPYSSPEDIQRQAEEEKRLEVAQNKELACIIQEMTKGTHLQDCLKAHEYYAYCDFRYLSQGKGAAENIGYLDDRYNQLIEHIYINIIVNLYKSEIHTPLPKLPPKFKDLQKKSVKILQKEITSKNLEVAV